VRVISINTYAGSLLLGARGAGAEIIASLEDEKGYGTDIQRLNFGKMFPIRALSPRRWHWDFPEELKGVVVVAHPPCSAFSNQNNSPEKKGLGSDAFKCTTDVLDFAMGKRADVVLIESVPPAAAGAKEIHDSYALKHGYRLYRLMQNAITFGVPQDRTRFWAIFVRDDIAMRDFPDDRFRVSVDPVVNLDDGMIPRAVKVKDVVAGTTDEEYLVDPPADIFKDLGKQIRKWLADGLTMEYVEDLTYGRHGYGMLNTKIDGSKNAAKYQLFKFGTRNVRLLDPEGFCTTLLSDSFWMVRDEKREMGRLVTESEYKAFMGFPRDYEFPAKYKAGKFREYLSKGVCPPVAAWLLKQVDLNLYSRSGMTVTHDISPGSTLDVSYLRYR
jgi:site-specific DNA-cytosine methylase